MKELLTLVGAAMVAACGNAGATRSVQSMVLRDPPGPVVLIREARGSEAGGADLHGPVRPTLLNGNVWVLDVGNDRLVRFDSALSTAKAFGREGEGPGEIQFAMDFVADADSLLVTELGNDRVSVFDSSGVFRRTRPAPQAPDQIVALRGALLGTTREPAFYTRRLGSDGKASPHAAVPTPLRDLARSDPAVYSAGGPGFLAAGAAGSLYVLDQTVLAVTRYDAAGAIRDLRLLPEPFRGELLRKRRAELSAFDAAGAAFIASPVTKRISLDDRGRLLIPFPLPDYWGILVDPADWTARPLPLPGAGPVRDILWSASDARFYGDRLFVTGAGQLYEFRVEEGS